MATTPDAVDTALATLEPGRRTIRTVVAVTVALALALPVTIEVFTATVDLGPTLTAAFGQVLAYSTAITRLAATPLGNRLFGWLGLSATPASK